MNNTEKAIGNDGRLHRVEINNGGIYLDGKLVDGIPLGPPRLILLPTNDIGEIIGQHRFRPEGANAYAVNGHGQPSVDSYPPWKSLLEFGRCPLPGDEAQEIRYYRVEK